MKKIYVICILFWHSSAGAQPCGSPELLQSIVESFVSGRVSESEAITLAKPQVLCLSQSLHKSHVENEIVSQSRTTILIKPSKFSDIGRSSENLQSTYGVTLAYDFSYFLENPNSAGTYSRETRTMIIGSKDVLKFNANNPIFLHEMVHVKSWQALLLGQRGPLQGVLFGPLFQPNELWLDEIVAYGHDMAWAILRLQRRLAENNTAESARWRQVWDDCLADKPPLADLSETETLWRSLCRKGIILGWHVDPAITLLETYVPDSAVKNTSHFNVVWDKIVFGENSALWPAPSVVNAREFASALLIKLHIVRQKTSQIMDLLGQIAHSAHPIPKIAILRMPCEPEVLHALQGLDASIVCGLE